MESSSQRIAMWSGPRSISTAMMRAWGSRADTYVCDEPLYAHYLKQTGLDHPGAADIIEQCETDWRKVVDWLTGPIPMGKPFFFQKHMTHHMLPDIELDWLSGLTHFFLIREPGEMLTSLIKFIPQPTLQDTGLPQQVHLFEHVMQHEGRVPPVLDARDVLIEPAGTLRRLCDQLAVPFTDLMLSWPPGKRETDGIWAQHWYRSVEQSTGFAQYKPKKDKLPGEFNDLLKQCNELYAKLHEQRITV